METIKYILSLIGSLATFTKELEDARKDIKELRQTVERQTLMMQRLSDEIIMNDQKHCAAIEKLKAEIYRDMENHKLQVKVQIMEHDGKFISAAAKANANLDG